MTKQCGKNMKRRVPLRESPGGLENESCGFMMGLSVPCSSDLNWSFEDRS